MATLPNLHDGFFWRCMAFSR